ncbi:MAG: ATP phosphoribosyltransferase [Candidatus Pacebacteria bacterium]|nr:ATP phosphoribosyltransferase [Candidatus Paceibacterota bacterium]
MLKIALPAGKSLEARTSELFTEARITIDRKGSMHEVAFPDYPSLSAGYFLKPRRIPLLVEEGDFDIGITGVDFVLESGADVEICAELSYSRSTGDSTLGVLFAQEDDTADSPSDVPDGSIILSEYPNLTRKFLEGYGKRVVVVESPGSAEAEVPLKYRFGVALSETGKSLRENRLKPIGTVFKSSTVLIANKEVLTAPVAAKAVHVLKLILCGVLEARGRTMFTMNVPTEVLAEVLRILPSLRSPTVAPLAGGQFASVSTVMRMNEVNGFIPSLLELGAEGFVTTPISSVIQSW